MTPELDAPRLDARTPFPGPRETEGRKLRKIMILAGALSSLAGMTVSPAHAVNASGTATMQCGAFSGDPQKNPAWVQSAPYAISEDQISLTTSVRDETNQWNGTIDGGGHILLTGSGSGGGGAWVMHFTGKWRGAGGTRLVGGYHNVRGMVGHRACSISF